MSHSFTIVRLRRLAVGLQTWAAVAVISPLDEITHALAVYADGRAFESEGPQPSLAPLPPVRFRARERAPMETSRSACVPASLGSRDGSIERLMEDVARQVKAGASTHRLLALVEERLRRHVPLLSVEMTSTSKMLPVHPDCVAFDLARSEKDEADALRVEFLPACTLDDSQRQMLRAGAEVMRFILEEAR